MILLVAPMANPRARAMARYLPENQSRWVSDVHQRLLPNWTVLMEPVSTE